MKFEHAYYNLAEHFVWVECSACKKKILENETIHHITKLDLPRSIHLPFFICMACAPTKDDCFCIAEVLYSIKKL